MAGAKMLYQARVWVSWVLVLWATSVSGQTPTVDPCAAGTSLPECLVVGIDFTNELGEFRNIASGFNGHVDSEPFRPAAAHLEFNLKPRFWRGDSFCRTEHCEENVLQDRAYRAVIDNGGAYQKLGCKAFAESYGYDCFTLENVVTWDRSRDGEQWYRACYDEARDALSHGRDPQWDVWNEPDITPIFKDRNNDFMQFELAETYRICFEGLVDAYADAGVSQQPVVGGPSISAGPWGLVRFLFATGSPGQVYVAGSDLPGNRTGGYGSFGFLRYLNDRPDLRFDFMTLHIFTNESVMKWAHWLEIVRAAIREEITAGGLDTLRQRWGDDLSGLPIYVNEMMGSPSDQEYYAAAGHSIVAIAEMHQARVAGAGKACWPDPGDGSEGCSNKTISGLLVPDGSQDPSGRRPVWWAYKYYAELQGREAAVESDYPRVAGVAAADIGQGKYRALLGFTAASADGEAGLTTDLIGRTRLDFRGLADCEDASVRLQWVSAPQFKAFDLSDLAVDELIPAAIVGGELAVGIAGLAAEDVLYVTIDTTACPVPPEAPTGLRLR